MTRHEAGRPVRIATGADRGAVESAFLEALRVGGTRATPFTLAGEITVRWDGSTCAFEITEGLMPGVAALTFDNATGDPAGVQIVGVKEPHTWEELVALVPTIDVETATQPDWIVDAGGASDEAGTGGPVTGSVRLDEGTYGPLCVTGTWPDVVFRPGQPFVVAAP